MREGTWRQPLPDPSPRLTLSALSRPWERVGERKWERDAGGLRAGWGGSLGPELGAKQILGASPRAPEARCSSEPPLALLPPQPRLDLQAFFAQGSHRGVRRSKTPSRACPGLHPSRKESHLLQVVCGWVALSARPGRPLLPAGQQPHHLQAPSSLHVVRWPASPKPPPASGPGPWGSGCSPPRPAPAPPVGTASVPCPCLPPLGGSAGPQCFLPPLSICLSCSPQCCCPWVGGHPQARHGLGGLLGGGPCPVQAQTCGQIGERGSICWAFRR